MRRFDPEDIADYLGSVGVWKESDATYTPLMISQRGLDIIKHLIAREKILVLALIDAPNWATYENLDELQTALDRWWEEDASPAISGD